MHGSGQLPKILALVSNTLIFKRGTDLYIYIYIYACVCVYIYIYKLNIKTAIRPRKIS